MDKTKCPKECGGTMVRFTSLYKKKCVDCGKEFEWPLKEGQKGVYE